MYIYTLRLHISFFSGNSVPKDHPCLWLWAPDSIVIAYMEPLGYLYIYIYISIYIYIYVCVCVHAYVCFFASILAGCVGVGDRWKLFGVKGL